MLEAAAAEVRKHYYDPKMHGVDWDAKLAEAKAKIGDASSRNMAFAEIAAMLDQLDDSHTYFIPPDRSFTIDYGWRLRMVGDRCFVMRIRPQTDAAAKLHVGDEVLGINGYKPTRITLERMEYVLDTLRPQSKLNVVVQSPGEQPRTLEIVPKVFKQSLNDPTLGDLKMVEEAEHARNKLRFVSLNDDVLVARLPEFWLEPGETNKLISAARKHKTLILDLRDNPGGAEDSLRELISGVFDHEVKIADAVTRNGTKARTAKPDHHAFDGKLIVLVDSNSMSAAELFARVIQLEKRGTVIGDRTLGMVMEAQSYPVTTSDAVFGLSVTVADLVMADGKSLEHVGVTPDELALPTPDDIAHDRDPVLARAVAEAGGVLSPDAAAKLFPYEWEKPTSISGQ